MRLLVVSMFNPRTDGGLSHLSSDGGGRVPAPPDISKTTQRSDKRQTALDRARQDLEEILRSFLSEVKNEVTRGQKEVKFGRFLHFRTKSVRSSETRRARKARKKAFDSSFNSKCT